MGKTIFALLMRQFSSTIIEDLMQTINLQDSFVVIYFYFDFKDQSKQSLEAMIRSLIHQVSTQADPFPLVLLDLYNKFQKLHRQPPTQELISTLNAVFESFQQVFLVVDALDECSDQASLFQWIDVVKQLLHDHLHLLVLSRRERYLEERLDHMSWKQCSLANAQMDADISTYVSDRLEHDPLLAKWPPSARYLIKTSLDKKARGM